MAGMFSIVDSETLAAHAGRTHLLAAQTGGAIGISEAAFRISASDGFR